MVIRTFLIADVRGYTLFTQERGDEAAAKLAARFASIARDGVEARGGQVIELRGDEALAVFGSARQAIRAAVDLQASFVDETIADPSLPLMVGIGIDAGEAVPVEGGYRGGALNLAARLCGHAAAGEVLASLEATHLARKVEGIRYLDRGAVHLKGLAAPVPVVKVLPEGADPALRLAPFAPSKRPISRRHFPRSLVAGRRGVIAGVIVALVAAALVPIALTLRGSGPKGLGAIGADSIGMIDLKSAAITRSIPAGNGSAGIALGPGAVWVANSTNGTVSRIDPDSGAVVPIQVGDDPTGVAVDAATQTVWVTNGTDGTVSRIDARSGQVSTIQVGNGPAGVVIGLKGVWVANSLDDTVSFIDPSKSAAEAAIPVGGTPTGLTIDAGAVWVTNATDGTVSRIDPGPTPVVRAIPVGQGPTGIASGNGAVWVANSLSGSVSRIDPSTNAVAALIPVEKGPGGIAAGGGAVWVADAYTASVFEIDPKTNQVTRTIDVGNAPQALASSAGSLWVSTQGAPTSHRGGTLIVADAKDDIPPTVDPTLAFSGGISTLVTLTNDGLVAFRHVGGAAGSTIAPDLATTIPVPTDEGLTYTFQLRSGVEYSNGRSVRPGDVRRGIERLFRLGSFDASLFSDLVGGEACLKHPRGCDLSAGIVANDATGTVTFHLTRKDPEFLVNLASPDAVVIPEGTPDKDVGTTPVSATGPYMVGAFTPGHRVEFVRNPKFHVWSPQAKPDGYPDRIVWVAAAGSNDASQRVRAIGDIEAGKADVFQAFGGSIDRSTNQLLEAFRTRAPAQAHDYLDIGTFYFFLNTESSPFNDLRVRQAVNYAVNRNKALDAYHQPGRVACQVIPPNMLGYRPYCPYTLDPNDAGTWDAPDIARATRLVAESDTRGQTIKMVEWQPFGDVARYVASVLRDLGYRVTLKIFPTGGSNGFPAFYNYVADSRNAVDMAGFWSVAFSTSPASWFTSALVCAARAFNDPNNLNPGLYCNRRLDTEIDHAIDAQIADPAASVPLWAQIDREATLDAPWLPLLTQGGVDLVSKRVGNYQHNPIYHILLDQLWVQ